MIRNLKPAIVWLFLSSGIIGCNNAAKEQELQQQKLLTELSKTNTQALAEMNKKQAELHRQEAELAKKDEDVKAREKVIQTSSDQVKQREETVRKRENDVAQAEKEFFQKIANEEARLQEGKDALDAAQKEIAAKKAEVDRKIQAIVQWQEAERRARQPTPQEISERIKRHEPHLERLALMVVHSLTPKVFETQSRKETQRELMDVFRNMKVAEIEEDDAFAGKAYKAAYAFVTSKIQPLGEESSEAYSATLTWFSDYSDYNKKTAAEKAAADKAAKAKDCCHRGFVYAGKEQYDEAILEFTEAIRLRPGYVDAYWGRGRVYKAKGEKAKAEADLAEWNRLIDAGDTNRN